MQEVGHRRTWSGIFATLAVALAAAAAPLVLFAPGSARADETDLAAVKKEWQGRYRDLRMMEARLVKTVELATKEYADSNRRTYRRSGVRHFHRTNANEAKAQLADVRTKIEAMHDQIREVGGSVNWLYEVDDEPIDPRKVEGLDVYANDGPFGGQGAYAPPDDEDADEPEASPGDGRNPLYSGGGDSEEDGDGEKMPAKLQAPTHDEFDYEAWREDREAYEKNRAAERPLRSDED